MEAINWNKASKLEMLFWNQNVKQFWVDTEVPLSDDKLIWRGLSSDEKDVYKKVLAGLTLLDTCQATVGMPKIAEHVKSPFGKSILGMMGMMEHMHAKSYSSIFTTFCTGDEIENLFKWVDNDKGVHEKLGFINKFYNGINGKDEALYIAMVCSVFLETFLFYSGFFYPLYLSGKGKMCNSGEIINLIIRDESIHGVYVGMLAKELFEGFDKDLRRCLTDTVNGIFKYLHVLEKQYTQSIYGKLGLEEQVDAFVRYNANKAFANCGLELPFPKLKDSDINPIVFKGLDTSTKLHDFFSAKGNGYVKAMKVEGLSDEDFKEVGKR